MNLETASLDVSKRPTPQALHDHWIASKRLDPMVRPFDLAQKLGVSELELVAARAGTAEVVRLRLELDRLLPELGSLGEVMGLTRNRSAVLEKHGTWSPFSAEGGVGLVLDVGLDLRLFLMAWQHAYAVMSDTPRGLRRSLQFFDAHGVAVHKVFVRETAEAEQQAAFDRLTQAFADADQHPGAHVTPATKKDDKPDVEIDIDGFREAWRALEDTHAFFPMLRRFGVGRTQALRLAPEGFASPAPLDACKKALEHAAATGMPIMIFVGNRGCIEIHTGPIHKVKTMGPWLNILDPETNLHLREDHVASAWIVTKPTVDGPVTSLELFDADGENIALLFGKRKPGLPEDPTWRAFARSLAADRA